MPDITMCSTQKCLHRYQCYRYMAIASKFRQTYSDFYAKDAENCDDFIQTVDGHKLDPEKLERKIEFYRNVKKETE